MDVRHVRRIVREEVRQRWRAIQDDSRYLLVLVGVPFGLVFVAGAAVLAFGAGRAVAAGETDGVVRRATTVVSSLVAYGLFLATIRAVQGAAEPTSTDGLLTVVPHREVVVATLAVESLLFGALLGVPAAAIGLAFALGAASPAAVLLTLAAVPLVVAIPVVAGFGAGYAIRNAIARSALLARYKSGLAVLALVAYFVALFATDGEEVFDPVIGAVAATPVGWLGHLVVLPVAGGDLPRAAAAAVSLPLAVVALVAVDGWLAAKLWYVTPAEPGATTGGESLSGLPPLDRTTGGVVRKTWARARRAPVRLVFVGYAGLTAAVPFVEAVQGAAAPWSVLLVVVSCAWAAGAAFTLNPVGEEGPALPVTLTTGSAGRPVIRGLWLAAALPGLLGTAVATAAFCLLAGVPPADLALLVAFGAGVAALSPGVASGIGVVFPRTEAVDVIGDRREVIPSLAAFVAFSLAMLVLTAPGWAVPPGRTRTVAAAALDVSPRAAGALAAVATLALLALAAAVSYRFAGRRLARYTLD